MISLGNLTVGGTGKTPLVDLVVSYLEAKNKTVGVVSRSYKAQAMTPQKVDPRNPEAAQLYGDEPLWLAQGHPKTCIYVGPEKWRTARVLENLEGVNIIIIDDGFQHLQLNRQLNLLLIDLSKSVTHYDVLPMGRAREPMTEFSRADFIIFTKAQNRNPQTEKWLEKCGVFQKPFAVVRQELADFRRINFETAKPFSFEETKINPEMMVSPLMVSRWLVVCGLADPESFLNLLTKKYPKHQFVSCFFSDHYQYTIKEVIEIERMRSQKNCQGVVITEKDEVKLRRFPKCSTWFVAPLKIRFDDGESEFYECLDEVIS